MAEPRFLVGQMLDPATKDLIAKLAAAEQASRATHQRSPTHRRGHTGFPPMPTSLSDGTLK